MLTFRHSTTPALSALTTARQTSPTTEGPLQLMSFNNLSAVDRVSCHFQAHGLSETCVCAQVAVLLLVLDVILEDCAVDLHGLVARVLRDCTDQLRSEVPSQRTGEGVNIRG